jgi:ABC-2 type transport system ATP-binding protein
MNIIQIKNLSKRFKKTQALDGVSLKVTEGQVLGLLGPNGAGKTTLIKSLVGSVKPTDGEVEVFGKNPLKSKKELPHRIGYMPQDACLYEDLSVKENIRFFAKLHVRENINEEIDTILEFLEMSERKHERVQNLSGGMKTRVSLACAMIHKPDILFLDEPTAGLDPSLKRSLWEIFRRFAGEGKTLFISTHLMDEALLCDRLCILQHGKLIADGTPDTIIAKGNVNITLAVEGQGDVKKSVPADPQAIANYLHAHGLHETVTAVDIKPETLEDIIIKIVDS